MLGAEGSLDLADDLVTVLDLRSTDDVLIVGGNVTFPSLGGRVSKLATVDNTVDLVDMIRKELVFDRVIVARERALDERVVLAATALIGPDGLVCFMSEDASLRAAFRTMVETRFMGASVWDLHSNVGHIVVTNARTED